MGITRNPLDIQNPEVPEVFVALRTVLALVKWNRNLYYIKCLSLFLTFESSSMLTLGTKKIIKGQFCMLETAVSSPEALIIQIPTPQAHLTATSLAAMLQVQIGKY